MPNPGNPADFDRYGYSVNNPVKYTDPSGHMSCEDMPWECDGGGNWVDDEPISSCSGEPDMFTMGGKTCYLVPLGMWHITTYFVSLESDQLYIADEYSKRGTSERVEICNDGGGGCETLSLPFRFLYGVEGIIEAGSGITNDGRYIHVGGYQGSWEYTNCSRSDGTVFPCQDYYNGSATFYWGPGLPGYNQVPYQTAAVGPSYLGRLYYVPALAALAAQSPNFPGNGYVLGNDRGGAIVDGDMDLYVGQGMNSAYLALRNYNLASSDTEVYKVVCVNSDAR